MRKIIYLDYQATTPLDPRVRRAMEPYLGEKFGNASSLTHAVGRQAARAVEKARAEVAGLVGADAREIVFTSGATESVNLALKGAARAYREKGRHLITLAIEHKAALDSCKRLETEGFGVTRLGVGRDGCLDARDLKKAIRRDTILVSVMAANNEIGVLQPVAEVAKIARERGILFHSDAAQAVGKIPLDLRALGMDLLSFSAHKICGPKGIGALVVRKREPRVRLLPLIDGGGHESGFRSGTLNVPAIVGFGRACVLAGREMRREAARTARLRNRLRDSLLDRLPDGVVNGSWEHRLPNNLNLSFAGVDAKALMKRLKNIALSSGSACTSTSLEPSYVLKAIGVSEERRRAAIRLSVGRFTTIGEIDRAVEEIVAGVKRMRKVAQVFRQRRIRPSAENLRYV
ncbi:MAG: cysteine desulfurase [Candidatus Omnitrophica bacterium]|nr:cysteine desulfurase [Candidatus Omnitrophota bacterium]